MKVAFLGGAKTVTGSCFLIETKDTQFLVDCGMFQGREGSKSLNFEPFPFNIDDIEFVLLTHCHIDHSGRIPKLYKEGFKGKIYATKATVELCSIMLPDSGHIQEMEHEWLNRKRVRAGKSMISPLYTYQDAVDSLVCFEKISYGNVVDINNSIKVRFSDAGHILGSSIIEVWLNEDGKESKIVFSGDLGNTDIPILKDPSFIESADYLFLESTYGGKYHKDNVDKTTKVINVILETIEKGGNVVIPSFAVGRTQEIIYDINKQFDKNDERIKKLFNIPVYIDSPLAINATEIFRNNLDCYDEEAREYIKNGNNPLDFPNLKFTKTAEESKELNFKDEEMIIISASGMCEAGRIKHHLKHNLWRPESTILFVGFQAEGTLGRRLVEGVEKVKIFGEEIKVKARIESVQGYSGHADHDGIINWLDHFKNKPKKIFIVHGEGERQEILSNSIKKEYNIDCVIPGRGDSYELTYKEAEYKGIDENRIKYKFNRLQLIEYASILQEEVEDIIDIVKETAQNDEAKDAEIEFLLNRIKLVEDKIRNIF